MMNVTPPPRRRWFQFDLGMWLVLVAFLFVWMTLLNHLMRLNRMWP